MKFRSALVLAVLAAPASVALAANTPSLSDPDSLPKVACTEFHYSAEFLKLYPKAPAACKEGREYNGTKYAKFTARVYLNSPDFTTVEMLNVAGDSVTTFSFKAPPDASVAVNGKPEKITDLKKGEEISFWVPEQRLAAAAMPGPTKTSWKVLPPK